MARRYEMAIEELRQVLASREIDPAQGVLVSNSDILADEDLLRVLARHLFHPNAGHLDGRLSSLFVGDRFNCGDAEWMVTDIGRRTLQAVKITDEVRADPSLLSGPSYAVAEIVFDEDDFAAIEPI